MSDKVEFKRTREFGEIINDIFLFIKQNFKPLMKVFIYLCGFFILAGMIAAIMQQLGLRRMGLGTNDPNNPFNVNKFAQLFTLNYLLVILFALLNYTAITVSVLSFIALYVQNDKRAPTVEEVWAYFKYYFFRVLGSSIGISIFCVLCFICCIIPFFYVFPAMVLFYPVMILENGSFSYAFSRSFKLLKDQWWITAATIFVIYIITYACMSFASMPAIILTMISTFTHGTKGEAVLIILTVLQYICQVFMILPVVGLSLCYYNLAERQENTGLLERINQFGESDKDAGFTTEEY